MITLDQLLRRCKDLSSDQTSSYSVHKQRIGQLSGSHDVSMKMTVLWDVAICGLAVYGRFRGVCCLQHKAAL